MLFIFNDVTAFFHCETKALWFLSLILVKRDSRILENFIVLSRLLPLISILQLDTNVSKSENFESDALIFRIWISTC